MNKIKRFFLKHIVTIIFIVIIFVIILTYKKNILHVFFICINFIKQDNYSFVFKVIIPIITFFIGLSTYIYNKKIRIKLRLKKIPNSNDIKLSIYNDSIRRQLYSFEGISLSTNNDILKRALYQIYLTQRLNIKLFLHVLDYEKENIFPYEEMLNISEMNLEKINEITEIKRIESNDFISYYINNENFKNAVSFLLKNKKNRKILKKYITDEEICLKLIFLNMNNKFSMGSLRIDKNFFNEDKIKELKEFMNQYKN